ncbi:hypothetical protein HUT19_02930 [Streptomyces sp. NA02950]|uniref:hypothetical protein n=1 Tax=Streptomyces sp. NA02950 TaxID=2742137 RepID=UPI001591F838|nr:hypothetical protein [Streptomyces sp. NA02950]QKV90822.1 hypothetical protein HUT19_02930 [Streptomyces sp. NA02950]
MKPPSTVDGRSLAGLVHGRSENDWHQAARVEYRTLTALQRRKGTASCRTTSGSHT